MLNDQKDIQLITSIKAGDDKALEYLFRKYYYSLCHFAAFYTNRDDLAEEIVADVFFKVWDKRKSLVIERNLKAYLFKATKHIAINYIKQEKEILDELNENIQEDAYTPMDALMFQELENGVTDLINSLPQQRKIIFQLNRFEGFTYNEIAEILSLSVKTIESQMGKAIRQLKHLYQTHQL